MSPPVHIPVSLTIRQCQPLLKLCASCHSSFTSLAFCCSHCSYSSFLCLLQSSINHVHVRDEFPHSPHNLDTQIIRTPQHVPLVSVLTRFHCNSLKNKQAACTMLATTRKMKQQDVRLPTFFKTFLFRKRLFVDAFVSNKLISCPRGEYRTEYNQM